MNNQFILELSQVGINDIEIVGGKNASLGEMIQNLTSLGINIPNGFVVTVAAYREFLEYNNLESTIKHILSSSSKCNTFPTLFGGYPPEQGWEGKQIFVLQ